MFVLSRGLMHLPLEIAGKIVNVLVDSGVALSIIGKHLLTQLKSGDPSIRVVPVERRIEGFNGAVSEVHGVCNMRVKRQQGEKTLPFFVVDANLKPILGKPELSAMNAFIDPVTEKLVDRADNGKVTQCCVVDECKPGQQKNKWHIRLQEGGIIPRNKGTSYRLICPKATYVRLQQQVTVPLNVDVKFLVGTLGMIMGSNK